MELCVTEKEEQSESSLGYDELEESAGYLTDRV